MSSPALPPAVILTGARPETVREAVLTQVIAALRPQSSALMINCNEPAAFANTGLEIRPAPPPFAPGYLAGIRAAMLWGQERGQAAVLTVTAHCPCLPGNLAQRLAEANAGGHIAVAAGGGQLYPAIAIWPTALAGALQHEMRNGLYRVRQWLERLPFKTVTFDAVPHTPGRRLAPSALPPADAGAWRPPASGESHGNASARH
jgi:molybdopterin-guanine dinucleotide biosynthesis protein A